MSKLPKDKRDKIILVGMGTVAAVAAIWFALINNQLRSHGEALKQREQAQQQLSRGQATVKSAGSVEESFAGLAARLKTCEAGMAAPNDMYSWLIQTLNTFRAGYQVEIPQFSRETPTEVGIFAKFPYHAASFTVRGTAYFHDFGKFLSDFENAFPYIRVQNLELEPGADSATAGPGSHEKLSFKMDLLTLVRPIAQ